MLHAKGLEGRARALTPDFGLASAPIGFSQGVQKWAKKALEKFTNPFVDSVFESMLGSPE